jgi:BirA family biotin operon repressor/biotin-[acetyl-CoA-carboxylase] ligase
MRAAELLPFLRTRDLGREAIFFDTCDSTQTRALSLARGGAPHGLLIHADAQTEGRGRRGRTWLSSAGSLTFSVVLTRDIIAENAAHYSFIAGLGVRRALTGTQLKWPNDIWYEGRKVGGVLASLETHPLAVVIGIGLNLSFDPATQDAALARRAGALDWQGDRAALLGDILYGLEHELARYAAGGTAATLACVREALALRGEKVHVRTQDGMVEGQVIDLAENFSLTLATARGTEDIMLGDVWPVERA